VVLIANTPTCRIRQRANPTEAEPRRRIDDPLQFAHRYRRSETSTNTDELGRALVEVLAEEPSSVPDVYFRQGYGLADAHAQQAVWISVAEPSGGWQMPLVLSDLGDGRREAISPYGFSGIHVVDDATEADAADAWDSARESLEDLGVVSLFLRFNPLDPHPVTMAGGFSGLTVERRNTTYVMAISEPEPMWDRLKSSCRSRIRKARKHGYSGRIRPAEVADLTPGSDFRRLYEATMERRAAATRYFFDDGYYSELLDGLGSDLLLAEVQDHDGVVASSCLLMRHDQRLHYHLAGSSPDGALMGTNNLMMWTAAESAFEQGISQFHLGGGLSGSDGLARFKSTFGSDPKDFHTGHAVIDVDTYTRLTQARADQLGTTVDALEASDYFPAFRASVG
jgi:hypothetical protein